MPERRDLAAETYAYNKSHVSRYASLGSWQGLKKGSGYIHLSLTAEHPPVVSLALFINKQSLSYIKVMESLPGREEHGLLC